MKQAVMTSPGQIEFRDVPTPKLTDNEVLVRMKRLGICGSDIHVYDGKHPLIRYPVVQGHEVSGIIEAVGSNVRDLKQGDAVTIQPQVYCGTCYPCMHGAYHICDNLMVMGFQTPGAASEFFSVEASKVLKLPSGIGLDHGAMIEPLSVGIHALERGGGAQGKKVVVLGAGPIGNLTAQAAKALGAEKIMLIDIADERLAIAERCGIDLCINTKKVELATEILHQFGKEKADLILECVGAAATIGQAIEVARKGSDIILVGVYGERPPVELTLVQDRELRLIGSLMYQRRHWEQAIDLTERNRVTLSPLLTAWFRFADFKNAYEHIEKNRAQMMKVMIHIDE